MMDAHAESTGGPCLSMPATASRSPWEHHWASTSVGGRGAKHMLKKSTIHEHTQCNIFFLFYLSVLSELWPERGHRSCSLNWYLLIGRWPSTKASLSALGRKKEEEEIQSTQQVAGRHRSRGGECVRTQRQNIVIRVGVAFCAVLHQEVGAVPGHAHDPIGLV